VSESKQGGRPYLSVVIPAYNEAARIGPTLATIRSYVEQQGIDAEILVVDDGSTDDTRDVAAQFLLDQPGRVLENVENRGKGYAVRKGIREAAGRWVLITDADLSTPIEEHARLATIVRDHDLDMAIASRALSDSRLERRQSWLRETMGKTFNALVRMTTRLPYRDTQCGFKLLDRERLMPIVEKMRVDGFAFDVELLFICDRFKLRVEEIPVLWRNDPDTRVGLITDPLRMMVDLARIRWRFRRGLYNPPEDGAQDAG
jgi:dolichyl-phosphate beta-glucosyltransferase